jgi:UTP--glucose-1-phosphate uridylyltransferase
MGRYVFSPSIFEAIDRTKPGAGGEIQLTDAMKAQAARSPFHGVVGTVTRHDTGNPFGWLTAVIDIALADPSIGPPLRDWLATRV